MTRWLSLVAVAVLSVFVFVLWAAPATAQSQVYLEYLGVLSDDPYVADSVTNPYNPYGNPSSPTSIHNPYGPYGSPFGSRSARNPYATDPPKLVAPDGAYLGRLSANPYRADSTSNPYGRYGSRWSPTSIHNPYSRYGSPFSWSAPSIWGSEP